MTERTAKRRRCLCGTVYEVSLEACPACGEPNPLVPSTASPTPQSDSPDPAGSATSPTTGASTKPDRRRGKPILLAAAAAGVFALVCVALYAAGRPAAPASPPVPVAGELSDREVWDDIEVSSADSGDSEAAADLASGEATVPTSSEVPAHATTPTIVTTPAPASAPPYPAPRAPAPTRSPRDEGRLRYDEGDYEGALALWLPLAGEPDGDASLLTDVARTYANADFDGADLAEAEAWFRKAAELGDAEAQTGLALSLLMGKAGPPRIEEGLEWLERAAEGGSAEAQYEFALHLLGNEGSEEIRRKGLDLLRKSAGQGLAGAQNHLGWMYLNAQEGLQRDYTAARDWFQRAAEADHPHAHFNLGTMLQKGFGTEVDLPLAFSHYLRAAELGNLLAMSDVGSMYAHGTGVEANHVHAREWTKRAARKGLALAQANLALLFDSKELNNHFEPWLALEHEVVGMDDANGDDGYHAVTVKVRTANQERYVALPLYRVPRAEFVLSAPRPGFPDEFRRPVVPPLDIRKVRPLAPEEQQAFLEANEGDGFRIAYPPFVAAMSGLPTDEEERSGIQKQLESLYERTSIEHTQQTLDDAFESLERQLDGLIPRESAPQ